MTSNGLGYNAVFLGESNDISKAAITATQTLIGNDAGYTTLILNVDSISI